MTAKIEQIGSNILRQVASPIVNPDSPTIQALVNRLIEIAHQANGVGIAAPQIGQSCRLFIVASCPNPRYPDAPFMPPTAMINPRIIAHSDQKVIGMEGCLSVQGKRGKVERYQEIMVEYCTPEGKVIKKEYNNFIARIVQHELDHLNGVLFVDHVQDELINTDIK